MDSEFSSVSTGHVHSAVNETGFKNYRNLVGDYVKEWVEAGRGLSLSFLSFFSRRERPLLVGKERGR